MRKNIKKIVSISVSFALVLGMTACGKKTSENNKDVAQTNYESDNLLDDVVAKNAENREVDDAFIYSTLDFSIGLFKKNIADATNKNKNVLVSPESVQTALAMAANGANSDTLSQMESVICPGLDINTLNEYLYTYNKSLTSKKDVKFNIANSIWFRNDMDRIKINDGFLCLDKTYYNAAAYMESFDDGTVDKINAWVNDNTNGMIPTLINNIPEEAVMYIINALAFEGEWETPYEENQIIENASFRNSTGETDKVTNLSSVEKMYLEGANAKGFMKYYKNRDFAFLAILPEEGMSVEEYVANMSADSYLELYNSRSCEDVNVIMPEFSYSYDKELKDILIDMGMSYAFEDIADFSKMATTKSGYLSISKVLHKTYIKVDREGTKASAVTSIEIKDTGCAILDEPKYIILDRPFVYAIVDVNTGLPIFIGSVNTVE